VSSTSLCVAEYALQADCHWQLHTHNDHCAHAHTVIHIHAHTHTSQRPLRTRTHRHTHTCTHAHITVIHQPLTLLNHTTNNASNGPLSTAGTRKTLFHTVTSWLLCNNLKERKGKEEYLYSAFLHQGTHKALRHGSHSFTCK